MEVSRIRKYFVLVSPHCPEMCNMMQLNCEDILLRISLAFSSLIRQDTVRLETENLS